MANPSTSPDKDALRLRCRASLAGLSRADRLASSEMLTEALSGWLATRPMGVSVGIFAATADEPDLSSLHTTCPSVSLAYPRSAADGTMDFHAVADPASLCKGRFGIREPDAGRHPLIPAGDLDLLVCPGLAFSPKGARLGRGGGYYDRYLERLAPEIPRLGICFPCQVVAEVPLEEHDVVMTHLVTTTGIVEVEPA